MDRPQPLDYSPPPRGLSTRAKAALIVVPLASMMIILLYTTGVVRKIDRGVRNALRARRVEQAMRYTVPSDRVVASQTKDPVTGSLGNLSTAAPPSAWTSIWRLDPTQPAPAVVFLHGRSVGKSEYLVYVEYVPTSQIDGPHFAARIFGPGTTGIHHGAFLAMPVSDEFAAASKRVFAGQADPIDNSHFTIHFEVDGKSGDIDGWLMLPGTTAPRPATVQLRIRQSANDAQRQ